MKKDTRLREQGLTSLGSAASIQLKAQTPPKGVFWLCVVILLQVTETPVSYICLLIPRRLGPLGFEVLWDSPLNKGVVFPTQATENVNISTKAQEKLCEILQ